MIPKLHVVTDDDTLRRDTFLSMAHAALVAGGPDLALHIRGPRTDGRRLFDLAQQLKQPAADAGSVLLVNDRVDVALTGGLGGAHLGQRSLPPDSARSLLGPKRLMGLSVHGPEEVPSKASEVLDYLVVGTIFPSGSHPEGPPGGMERIRAVAHGTDLPLIAIGGLTPERVGDVLQAGAYGVAVLEAVWGASDVGAAVRELIGALEKGTEA